MALTCVFCGAKGAMTREHVWPNWLSGLGIIDESVEIGVGRLNRLFDRRGPMPAFQVTVKSVCEKCNNGWMSDLEHEVRPVLAHIIYGNACTIDSAKQPVVAFWALKTLLTSMLTLPKDGRNGVAKSEYNDLYASVNADGQPNNMQVWIGQYKGERHLIQATPMVVVPKGSSEPPVPQAYVFSIVLGEALIQGVRFTDPSKKISLISMRNFGQVWPVLGNISWPVGKSVDDDSIERCLKGKELQSTDSRVQFIPWSLAVDLPMGTQDGSAVSMLTPCGKHNVFYPALLVEEARQGRFYMFHTSCECGKAYLYRTEPDGVHCIACGTYDGIESAYDALAGVEYCFENDRGILFCKLYDYHVLEKKRDPKYRT